jgi:hypothetical protein
MLFRVESFKAIAEKTILYFSSIRHSFLSLSYLIRFASLLSAQAKAILFKIIIKKSFAVSVPLMSTSLSAFSFPVNLLLISLLACRANITLLGLLKDSLVFLSYYNKSACISGRIIFLKLK